MTRVFDDSAQFIALFNELFARLEGGEGRGALEDMAKRRTIVQFRVDQPEVEMWVDGRESPVRVSFGPSDAKATFAVELTGDTMHEVLLGTLPLGKAMSSRRLKVRGSKLKALRLQGLFHALQSVYPSLAADELG